MDLFKNKRILISGVCGTVGAALVEALLRNENGGPNEVLGIDNDENGIFYIDQKYLHEDRARFFVLDIRDRDELVRKLRGVDFVFHTAALKHVVLCERSPDQAVHTNILGLQNIISAAVEANVGRFIFTSSDKAVNPTNVMGTSKLMGERLVTAANSTKHGAGPILASTRFGNVLGSNGSVVPIFHNQIANGGPVTLTHREMTRFVMTIADAARLVIDSCRLAQGGEVFITKMQVIRIIDLARAMIEELAPKHGYAVEDILIREVGMKPGEKLYEELMSDEEKRRAVELDKYFSILPAFRGIYQEISYTYPDTVSDNVTHPYISAHQTPLSVAQIRKFLKEGGLLELPAEKTAQRYWPGDKEQRS